MRKLFKTAIGFFAILLSFQLYSQNNVLVSAFSKSYEFENNKDYEGAIDAIKNLTDKSSYEANLRLGWLYYKIGFNRTANSYYETTIKQLPNSIEAKLAYINSLYAAGNSDNVILQYKKILEIDPNNTSAAYKLGLIYYYKNDFIIALPFFEKVLELYPFNYDALLMAAWTNVKLNKNAEAEVLFNQTLLYSTTDKSAWEGLTYIKGDAAKQDKLRKAFGTSYELAAAQNYTGSITILKTVYDKTSYELNLRLAALCSSAGLNKEAVTYYKTAIELKPKSIEPHLGIVTPIAALGNMNELIAQYNTILALDPQNTTANYRLGYINYEKKDFTTAANYFTKIINLYPCDYDGLLMMAKTNLSLGNTNEAKSFFTRVLLLYPTDKSALEGLASIK